MAGKKSGLGRGLDSLIQNKNGGEEKPSQTLGSEVSIDINKVEPNRDQPRKHFDEDALIELSESIKQYGIIEPLLVQKRKDYYEIIAGERRWRAAKKAGLKEVPVIIKNFSDQQIVEVSLIENIQREDLNPIEEALAYKRLLEEFDLKQDEVAEKVSKSRAAVTNSMRLLKLDERVQQMLIDDMISQGHARAILAIEDKDKQYEFAQRVFDEKMSVRDVEKEIRKMQKESDKPATQKKELDPKLLAVYHDLEEKLKQSMGTKVTINPKDATKGKIEIEYYSQDELDSLIDKLQSLRKN